MQSTCKEIDYVESFLGTGKTKFFLSAFSSFQIFPELTSSRIQELNCGNLVCISLFPFSLQITLLFHVSCPGFTPKLHRELSVACSLASQPPSMIWRTYPSGMSSEKRKKNYLVKRRTESFDKHFLYFAILCTIFSLQ